MIFTVAAGFFIAFITAYALLTAAALYHLHHYTLPGWTAARLVVSLFFLFSAVFFAFAVYFFLTTPWSTLGG